MAQTDLSWQGLTMVGTDGKKIGKVEDLYDDESGGQPLFATVKTGLFGGKSAFVPLKQASEQGGDLAVPYTKEFVSGSPHIAADAEISAAEEQEIYSYYSLGSDGFAATTTAPSGGGNAGREDLAGQPGIVGRDTSGATTDDAMTRSEERVRVGSQQVQAGRALMRKRIVTEQVTQTVPVSHEVPTVTREPITEANRGAAMSGGDLTEEEHEVVLTGEQVVVDKEVVPVERVRLGSETVTGEQQVNETVRKEQIEVVEDNPTQQRWRANRVMGFTDRARSKTLELQGGLKEQAGRRSGTKDLQAKGQADQAKGSLKGTVGKIKDRFQ